MLFDVWQLIEAWPVEQFNRQHPLIWQFKIRCSSNNSHPFINSLSLELSPSRHLLFLLSSPFEVEAESDPVKLTIEDASPDTVDIDTETFHGAKFGTFTKRFIIPLTSNNDHNDFFKKKAQVLSIIMSRDSIIS